MNRSILAFGVSAVLVVGQVSRADDDSPPEWVEPMRQVHTGFSGTPGTLALFGDSISVSLAFWAPLQGDLPQAVPELQAALRVIHPYQREECWRAWRGPDYGNEGRMTIRWARDNIDAWLDRLNPEVAVIMFGTNDLTELEAEEFDATTREVVERCLERGTVVILTTLPPRHGLADKSAEFADIVREISRDLQTPLVDYHAEVLSRRPEDWDGADPRFREISESSGEYEVPTMIAGDGVHPSNPQAYLDYSEESLDHNGFALRNYLTALRYAEVIESVLDVEPDSE
jgi:hypothetical protein